MSEEKIDSLECSRDITTVGKCSPDNEDDYCKPTFSMKPLDWEEDLEMSSKYIDRKEQLKADHATYMRQNPELQAIVGDFLQHLLLHRPDNVLASASEYFSTFSAKPLPPQSTFARKTVVQDLQLNV